MKKLEDGLIDSKRILITSTCKTLSAKSTLTYQIGTEDDELHVRITKNTGGGFFSDEWISMNGKKQNLEAVSSDEFTAKVERLASSSNAAKKKVTSKRPTKKTVSRKKTARTV